MPAKPLEIGTLTFAKKGDAVEHCREILYRHTVEPSFPNPRLPTSTGFSNGILRQPPRSEWVSRNSALETRCSTRGALRFAARTGPPPTFRSNHASTERLPPPS